MATDYEQIILKMGFDIGQVEAGTGRMLAIQENAQAKIRQMQADDAAYYKTLLESRAASDTAYYAEQLAKAKAYHAESAALATEEAEFVATRQRAVIASSAAAAAGAATYQERKSGALSLVGVAEAAGGIWLGSKFFKGAKTVEEAERMAAAGKAGMSVAEHAAMERAAKAPAWMAEQSAKYAEIDEVASIAKGSVPENLANLGKAAGEAGESLRFGARVWSEMAVIVREGLRGQISRVLGSMSIITQLMWHGFADTIARIPGVKMLAEGFGKIGGRILGPILDVANIAGAGYEFWKYHQAKVYEKETAKNLAESVADQAEDLRGDVTGLGRLGKLSSRDVKDLLRLLKHPTAEGNQQVFRSIFPLMEGQGTIEDMERAAKVQEQKAKLDEAHQKNVQRIAREGENLSQKLTDDMIRQSQIKNAMAGMDADSIEYKKLQLELDKAIADGEKDKADIIKNRLTYEREIADKKREVLENLKEEAKAEDKIGRVTPTLEDLAGRDYTKRLNAAYGEGGIYDLGAGNGPFAAAARDAELAQKQQMWDLIHGNAVFDAEGNLIGGDAFGDRQRALKSENMLRGAGIETPDMVIKDLRDKMIIKLEKLGEDIVIIRQKAATDGIKLADD